MRIGEAFTGYGGLGLGVEDALGGEIVWHAENNRAASRVLRYRAATVPNFGDVTTLDWHRVPPVDVLAGGTPCQDLSHAGNRAGMHDGTRSNLWVAMRTAIDVLRPRLVVWENVVGAYSACATSQVGNCPRCVGRGGTHQPNLRALGRVLGDLADCGYDARWCAVRASDVGAPHKRTRVFLLAYPRETPPVPQTPPTATLTSRGSMLPTPRTSDVNGPGRHGDGGLDLRTRLTLLPTPAVNDMGRDLEVNEW